MLRPVIADDDAKIASIIRNSLFEHGAARPGTVYFDDSTDHLSILFEKKRSAYFVATVNEIVAGGAGFFPTPGLDSDTCELVKMYLAPEFRNLGLGQLLLDRCMVDAANEGYTKIYIETMPELLKAIHLYTKNGFKKISSPLGNSGHSGCNIFMVKEIVLP